MGKHDVKLTPKQRLLRDNPWCCHCGGNTRSTTVDHVPPQAAILNGRFPEDHEFPGCDGCNGGTKRDDHIFALHCMELDTALPDDERPALEKLRQGVANNYPEGLLTEEWTGQQRSLTMSPEFGKAVETVGAKMACAYFYKHGGGRFLTAEHRIFTSWLHATSPANTAPILKHLANLLPNVEIGRRSNIKDDRIRFASKFGFKEDDFFMVASQFGTGLIVWSIATKNPAHEIKGDPRGSVRGIFGQR